MKITITKRNEIKFTTNHSLHSQELKNPWRIQMTGTPNEKKNKNKNKNKNFCHSHAPGTPRQKFQEFIQRDNPKNSYQ